MGSLALLARELGHRVTGSDQNVYPPMSTQLEQAGITLMQGYEASHLQPHPDLVVVGNACKRGMPAVEYMLDQGLRYTSGPQFLAEQVLPSRHVLAVAGTHGKTTTTTMLAWILEQAGLNPGFLIGGVPLGFSQSARLGERYFVVEADEYDSAFFDKRSKFVHYQPRTLILNNLEFDHADIFDDLAAIQRQFHHLIRIVPASGRIILPQGEPALESVLARECWTPVQRLGFGLDDKPAHEQQTDWQAELLAADGSAFAVHYQQQKAGEVHWQMTGLHNVSNGLAAIAAAQHVGVDAATACAALSCFGGIKRRMELLGTVRGIDVYDDFAHHPTAIDTTLDGIRKRIGQRRLWAIIEPRSNTMRMGQFRDQLAHSARQADEVIWYQPPGLDWDLSPVVAMASNRSQVVSDLGQIITQVSAQAQDGDAVVIMSNGGFGGLHQQLLAALRTDRPLA